MSELLNKRQAWFIREAQHKKLSNFVRFCALRPLKTYAQKLHKRSSIHEQQERTFWNDVLLWLD